ncbi:type II toxin-antitoxin system death-on-curing family toxin [Prosthecobacter sp.]|uniref:type II toxin-antitoxin system death-on-curing family toxin n=1 Tax=Prosthecobacter sp. TaxID=1965333 RepID=UPI0037842957
MKEPYWLTREECLALHDMMLSDYGGIAGLRDEHLLESAISRPQQLFHYGKLTLAEMAAAYAAGIVKNYPFLDGNKRTGFMLGAGFLERNGREFHATEADAVLQTLALAAGETTEAAYAEWLHKNSKRA